MSWDICIQTPFFPVDDRTHAIRELQCGGGMAANTLATAKRLGFECALAAVVGGDRTGKLILHDLKAEGIDARFVHQDRTGTSPTAYCLAEESTGRKMIIGRASTEGSRPRRAPSGLWEMVESSRMVHTDGWRPEISLEAMKRARKSGVPVSYDAGHGSNHVETLIKNSDTVIASESLVRELLGRRSPKSAVQRLGEMGPSTAVITYGERGSIAARDGQTLSIGVYRVDAQDTTGAGDAFRGGYIAAQLRGCDFETSLRAASATAAMCCRELSSRGGLPRSWGTLRAFMRRAVYEEPKS